MPAKPKTNTAEHPIDELVAEMVRDDLKVTERDEQVKKHGYSVLNCHE